jgi:hypothetical protein
MITHGHPMPAGQSEPAGTPPPPPAHAGDATTGESGALTAEKSRQAVRRAEATFGLLTEAEKHS